MLELTHDSDEEVPIACATSMGTRSLSPSLPPPPSLPPFLLVVLASPCPLLPTAPCLSPFPHGLFPEQCKRVAHSVNRNHLVSAHERRVDAATYGTLHAERGGTEWREAR